MKGPRAWLRRLAGVFNGTRHDHEFAEELDEVSAIFA